MHFSIRFEWRNRPFQHTCFVILFQSMWCHPMQRTVSFKCRRNHLYLSNDKRRIPFKTLRLWKFEIICKQKGLLLSYTLNYIWNKITRYGVNLGETNIDSWAKCSWLKTLTKEMIDWQSRRIMDELTHSALNDWPEWPTNDDI